MRHLCAGATSKHTATHTLTGLRVCAVEVVTKANKLVHAMTDHCGDGEATYVQLKFWVDF